MSIPLRDVISAEILGFFLLGLLRRGAGRATGEAIKSPVMREGVSDSVVVTRRERFEGGGVELGLEGISVTADKVWTASA